MSELWNFEMIKWLGGTKFLVVCSTAIETCRIAADSLLSLNGKWQRDDLSNVFGICCDFSLTEG